MSGLTPLILQQDTPLDLVRHTADWVKVNVGPESESKLVLPRCLDQGQPAQVVAWHPLAEPGKHKDADEVEETPTLVLASIETVKQRRWETDPYAGPVAVIKVSLPLRYQGRDEQTQAIEEVVVVVVVAAVAAVVVAGVGP